MSFLTCTNAFSLDLSLAEKSMHQYFKALKTYDTTEMASLMHPEALKRFRGAINSALHGKKQEFARKELLPVFGTTDLVEYQSLSDREAFKRLNDAISNSAPLLIDMLEKSDFKIINISEKSNVAYVVYILNIYANEQKASTEIVQKLKIFEDKWLLLLSAEADATIAGINAKYN